VRKLLLTLLILTLFISISYSQLSIKIVSPKNGEKVSGNVTIKVEVSDPTNVSKVEFYINNEKVGEVTKSPFEYILDTTLFPNGEYNVIVRAYEKTGSMIGISVNIKIENIYNDWQKIYGGSNDDVAYSIQQTKDGGYIVAGSTRSFGFDQDAYVIKLDENGNLTYSVNNLIYSSNMVKEKIKSAMKIMQTALEMNATDNNGNYTDNLLDLLDYLPDNQFPKHPLTNKPYEIGINLFDPVNGGSTVKNSSDIRYQYAIVYKYDASNNTYTLIGYDQTNTKVIFELSNR